MEILLSLVYIFLFLFIIWKSKLYSDPSLSDFWLHIFFLVKLVAGIGLGLLYTYYYTDRSTADVYKYFDDAKVLYSAFEQGNYYDYFRMLSGIGSSDPELSGYYDLTQNWFKEFDTFLFNDNRTIIRFNALLMPITGQYFFVHTIIMAFLSYTGTVLVFKTLMRYSSAPSIIIAAACFLVPSFAFWSSGLLKEGLLVFGLGLFFSAMMRIADKNFDIKYILSLIAGLSILLFTKYYVLISMLPAIIFLALGKWIKTKPIVWAFAIHLALLFFTVLDQYFLHRFNVLSTLALKRNNFIHFVDSLPQVGSKIDMALISPTVIDFIRETPQALFNVYLAPMPWQMNSVLAALPFAENILLVLLIIFALRYRSKQLMPMKLAIFTISFTAILYWTSGITTPVVGSLVRYKIPAMPFLYAWLSNCIGWEKLLGSRWFAKTQNLAYWSPAGRFRHEAPIQ